AGLRMDVFTISMLVPNSLYMLLAGGTLNNVLVPQIVRAVLHDEDKGKAFVDRIMTAFLASLAVLAAILTVAVPWVMTLYAAPLRDPGMADAWQNLLLMSYITMPQLFFFGVFFLIGQVLNARDVFGPMMWAPIVNNVVSITVLGIYIATWGSNAAEGATFTNQQIWLLGGGSTLGIIAQTLVLLPFLRKAGFSYRPRFDLKGTGLGRTFHVAKWMVGYVALTSLAQVVVTNLASTASPAGGAGPGAYQNAYLIWILPHSLLTVSLATAMLPAASRSALAGDLAGVTRETDRAIRLATTFLVPASLGLIALALPLTALLFGHGQGGGDFQFVAWALMGFAVGLVPFTIQYLYLRAFYALDNTRTPFLLQIAISGANALLAVAFVVALDSPGTVAARLALSYSVAYFLGWWLTHRALSRRIPDLPWNDTLRHLARLLLAALPAAALAFGVNYWLSSLGGLLWSALGLAVAAGVAVIAYFFTAKRMGIPEASELIAVLRRRPVATVEVTGDLAAAVPLASEIDPRPESWGPDDSGDPPPAGGGEAAMEVPAPVEEPEPVNPDPDGVGVFVTVEPEGPPPAVLDFPEPADDETTDPIAEPTNLIDIGRLLAGRYRLAELLAERGGHQTWRAEDTVLTRPVLIHLLQPDDRRSDDLLGLARRAALATDSRFLRVLDVVPPAPGEHGAYLVYEYATGQTLQRVLAGGPLTGAETAWVVREVADALVALHPAGVFHRHLSPATVLITASGNVKIIGLLVDEVLSGAPARTGDDGEAADVTALGRLLYACLVVRWPGKDAYGLPAAPEDEGRLLLPSQVRSGVAHPVDVVVDRILSPVPRQQASRLHTAAEVTTELSLVLGPISSAGDLRLRLDHGQGDAPPDHKTSAAEADEAAGVPAEGAVAALRAVSTIAPPVPVPARPRFEMSEPIPDPARLPGGGTTTPATSARAEEDTPPPFTPVPPPPEPAQRSGSSRAGWWLGGAGLLAAIVGGLWLALSSNNDGVPAAPTQPAVARLAIAEAIDFDPRADGGSAQENPKETALAIDGDRETAWHTERYRKRPDFGGLKPGVGLVLDLGTVRTISEVKITLLGGPTALEARVPAAPATGEAPMESQQQWRRVAGVDSRTGSFTLGFDAEETRYLLVYLTELPPVEENYFRGAVAEIEVFG
ncbi:MAG: murein biosynthesis integral membrane protein MurJ, partial [Propionibacteriaceae bacterium]|nr:murein biosynthesis integral membrane protein MurJ [Propionibacteriaceae bacterium]